MGDTDVPDAAVQIAVESLSDNGTYGAETLGRDVVAALARAGWLTPPDRVAALEAVAEAARKVRINGAAQWLDAPLAALDADPPD